jgi:hypothetical protein
LAQLAASDLAAAPQAEQDFPLRLPAHTWISSFEFESVYIVFVFDENQRLVGYDLFPANRIL